ncbi:MAG TPA: cytochrome c oxidase subunit 3 [Terriglobales bacterium]|nr:cytochrome c oxidase subunit 3 [Terriglobales bacterium]
MRARQSVDVSQVPELAFGSRSTPFWGTFGLIVTEGMIFVLLLVTYYYLRGRSQEWPPGVLPPYLVWGTINLALLLISAVPNQWYRKRAEQIDSRGTLIGLAIVSVLGLIMLGVRTLEFRSLNVRYDANAYGSIVWAILGFHTAHLLTDLADTILIALVFFFGPLEKKRFMDASDNAMYWWFVVVVWIPVYITIYLAPMWM